MTPEQWNVAISHDRGLRVTANEYKLVMALWAAFMVIALCVLLAMSTDHLFLSGVLCGLLLMTAAAGVAARALADKFTGDVEYD